ncbi:hypothetical protein RFI_31129, partial [Reticulomyxa filosa]
VISHHIIEHETPQAKKYSVDWFSYHVVSNEDIKRLSISDIKWYVSILEHLILSLNLTKLEAQSHVELECIRQHWQVPQTLFEESLESLFSFESNTPKDMLFYRLEMIKQIAMQTSFKKKMGSARCEDWLKRKMAFVLSSTLWHCWSDHNSFVKRIGYVLPQKKKFNKKNLERVFHYYRTEYQFKRTFSKGLSTGYVITKVESTTTSSKKEGGNEINIDWLSMSYNKILQRIRTLFFETLEIQEKILMKYVSGEVIYNELRQLLLQGLYCQPVNQHRWKDLQITENLEN